ncbi:Kelch repeat type 1 [Macleaya cordata]|uniref:Kelch repeat type 1 n=1 Tax=Macleaya cordata TaxID=56857 RepID=A0A200RC27_MACCD|nr:Kelch repeat type 1 [Macleaya cordata]
MGSLPSPPSPRAPSAASSGNSAANHRLWASFCPAKPTPNTRMTNWIAYYDLSNNSWNRIGFIPGLEENQILKGFAMVAVGESIFIIGGRLCRKEVVHESDEVNEVDIGVLATVYRYDIGNNLWSRCAPLGTPRFDFAYTVYDNKIYVAGGQCTSGSARGISSAELYNLDVDTWTPLPKMSTLRYKSGGVPWQGKIHVVGGFAEREDAGQPELYNMLRSSAEVFDPRRGEWDLVEGIWQLDIPPNQIVAVEGRLFSSGDCLNTWKGHIDVYDGQLNIWNVVNGSKVQNLSSLISTSDANMPIKMRYVSMAPIGTHLYFIAGYRMIGELGGSISVVHAFDTSARSDPWKSSEPIEEEMDKELCSHCCVVQVS